MAGRPREGRPTAIRLSDEDIEFAKRLSELDELADGVRMALDEARQARGMRLPKRPTRRIVTIVRRVPKRGKK